MANTVSAHRVEFNKKDLEIIVIGHFPDFVCGYLTAICRLLQNKQIQNKLKVRSLVMSNHNDYDPEVKDIYKFKTEEEYKVWVDIIKNGFKTYKRLFERFPTEAQKKEFLEFKDKK